ncbi:hypothetical protein [Dyella lutea]|uniref:Carboxypeptidase regulatory-like domain-containing protein n=1 Tax=Dyella lutea TaxID=2950441 RepID=A0ABT1F7A1_9GAMM|nr:hypothetical protein [Dyella lutea]MCP1373264.1 hypothetical protein [Dyella lutea]
MMNPARTQRVWLLSAFLLLLSVPGMVFARATCVSGLDQMTTHDGARLFMASSSYDGLAANQALDAVQRIAQADGYVIATKPSYDTATPSLGLGKPPSPTATLVQIQPPSRISFTSIVPAGAQVDPQEVRTRLCALVAGFDAGRPASSGQSSGGKTAVERLEESRTTIPETRPSVNLLKPGVPFDLASAKAALEPGHSIIRGQVCGAWRGNLVLGTQPVALYPATTYLEQLVALAKKAKPGRDRVLMDPEMASVRMVAKPNDNGEFQFSQMKPGKYYLVTSISALLGGSRDVYAGTVTTGYGSADVYTSQDFSYGSEGQIERFVKVRKDGAEVKVTMQPPISPFSHAGLGGSILGCSKFGMKVSHGL